MLNIKSPSILIFLIICLLHTNNLLNAQSIKMQVVNITTKAPVPFASITNNKYLSVADSNGYFFLPSDIRDIIVSSVGYKTKKINLEYSQNVIFLDLATFTLNDVLVKPLVFRDFYLNYKEKQYNNLEQKPFDAKFFYREFTKIKDKYVDFNEAFGLYHFEGMGNYDNVDANNLIKTIDNVRSLNVLFDKKIGLHQVNWLSAANNVSKYLILNFVGFYSAFDWRIDKVISESDSSELIEISYKPKPQELNFLKSKQSRRGDIHAGIIGSEGKVYIDKATHQLKKFVFATKNFGRNLRSYRKEENGKFTIIKANGELTLTENEFGKTVPLFLGYNISYSLKEKPNELIEKRLEFYFSDYDLSNQKNVDLEKKYKSKILFDFPTRAQSVESDMIFYGALPYNEIFWKQNLPYPDFFDIEKVKSDLKNQGVDINEKFKSFINKYK